MATTVPLHLTESVQKSITPQVRHLLATRNNLTDDTAGTVAEQAVAALVAGLQRNAASPQGAEQLSAALAKDHDGSVLKDVAAALTGGELPADGQKIVQHIFGAKQPAVAKHIADETAVQPGAASDILNTLAPIVLGALGKKQKTAQLDASGLADQLLRQRLPKTGAAASIVALLDRDKDGMVLDDIVQIGRGIFGKGKYL